jgi:hypothetical protein
MVRFLSAIGLMTLLTVGVIAQSTAPEQPTPETGFISREKYTNAFFGFSLPLPQDAPIRDFNPPSRDRSRHQLFGLQSQSNGLTTLGIMAFELSGTKDEAKNTVSIPHARNIRQIQIGGKQFWKSESLQKTTGGKMHSASYATAISGYTLRVFLISFDPKLAQDLERCIESITFFDPANANDEAGPDSHPYIVARPRP